MGLDASKLGETMSRDLCVYGITTVQLTAGLSTVVGVGPAAGILENVIVGMTGAGILYAANFSAANNGSLTVAGAQISSGALPLSLGVAQVYFTSKTADVVVSIMKKLSDGYSGQQTLTP
jgi:hypothetical protein